MKKEIKLLTLALLLLLGAGNAASQIPSTRIYDGEKLAKVKASASSEEYAPALTRLMNEADKALKSKPLSVMDKTMLAGSGDKHDYVSMGPYWWPNPSTPDGLPYIRKDGVRNPEATGDAVNIKKTISDISTLGIAYYFSGKEKYAAKAAQLTRIWFLNPETRMNPNMNYAQMIPGHNGNKGRGFGMIDVYPFVNMLDAVEMMNTSSSFNKEVRNGLQQWFKEYLEWIRTNGFSYTNYNLVFIIDMCAICHSLGIDMYNTISPDGRSIAKALAYMASFVGKPQSDFPYKQIKGWDKEQQTSCWILRRAYFYDKNSGWEDICNKHMNASKTDRKRLLYSLE